MEDNIEAHRFSNNHMSAFEALEQVKDKESFLVFLRSLAWDSETNPDEWENGTIAEYMESIEAWVEDYDKEDAFHSDYKEAAKLFYVGKIYE